MWTKLRLRNWRCFEDTGEMELAPLTVLIGPNSGGKSSILKAFLVLRQSAEERDTAVALVADGPYCSVGRYEEYVSRGDKTRKVALDAGWSSPPAQAGPGRQALEPHTSPPGYRFSVTWTLAPTASQGQQVVVASCRYRDAAERDLLGLHRTARGYEITPGSFGLGDLPPPRAEHVPLRFHLAPPSVLDALDPRDAMLQRAAELDLEKQLRATHYLGPLRTEPLRIYPVPEDQPSDVGLRGERAAEALYAATRARERLAEAVAEWSARLGLGTGLGAVQLTEAYFQVRVATAAGHTANVADVGFGVSQAFPVVVEGLYAPAGSTLLLEQPELHLNPRVQANLGDFFVHITRERHTQLIIETHSQHLLSRLRTHVVKGDLPPDQLAVYYCDLTPDGAKVRRLPVDELGRFQEWPPEFFEEEIREAFEQTQAAFRRVHSAGGR